MAQYTDKENVEIAQQEYENHKVGYSLETSGSGKYVGTLSDANNNRTNNGEQIFTYTKTSTGRDAVPPTASAEERAQVKEITIMYQGSASPSNLFTNPGEFGRDWVFNDAPEFLNIIKGNLTGQSSKAPGQLEASAAYLKEMMEKYPNAKINLYGHSLGSMDAQYAMAALEAAQIERIQQAYIYNGPDVYRILSPEQRKIVDQIKGRIYNYADPKDKISMVGRDPNKGSIGSVGMVYYVDSEQEGFVNQHMTYGYRLDKDGKIKILSNTSTVAYNNFLIKMESFKRIKKSLAADGFTSDERIFLDSEQAKLTASGICHIVTEELDVLKKIYNGGVQDASEVLVSCSNVPWGFILSPYETEVAYSDGGVTYETTVGVIQKRFTPVLDTAKQLEKDFTDLEKQIKNGIQKKLDEDKELANEFKQWESMI